MLQRRCLSSGHVFPIRQRLGQGPNGDDARTLRLQTMIMILSFIAVVFDLDLLTPLGISAWLLYSSPFCFIRDKTPRHF